MTTPNANKICDAIGGYQYCDNCPLLKICESTPPTVAEWEEQMETAATAILRNKEILSKCADLECDLFYAYEEDCSNEPLRELHKALQQAMETFAEKTGVSL